MLVSKEHQEDGGLGSRKNMVVWAEYLRYQNVAVWNNPEAKENCVRGPQEKMGRAGDNGGIFSTLELVRGEENRNLPSGGGAEE